MKYLSFLLILILFTKCFGQSLNLHDFTEKSKVELERFKKKNNIEGLSYAIFTNDNILFQECIGKSTYGYPITSQTLFSIQSISKNITALAIMFAIQERMLDLDTPISQYLNDFRINSCFENNPDQKITLRMLLSHTAGFTHEAPIGNNYDFTPCSYDAHIKSIESTWLKLPAGTDYSYSNLGFDLAAKIIETKSGLKFNDYLKGVIFKPLEMSSTTIDDAEFLNNQYKTEGTISGIKTCHYKIPLLGSGAVYTNLNDFIKYVQFQMNLGVLKNKTLLEKEYFLDMYKIRFNNYGLGTYIGESDGVLYINHNGSGYGFSATFVWFPEFNIGTVLLCNKQVNTFGICETIARDYIKNKNPEKNTQIIDDIKERNKKYFENPGLNDNIAVQHCTNDTVFKTDWAKYIGNYSINFKCMEFKWYVKIARVLGFKFQKIKIYRENNTLRIRSSDGESILREYKTGLFFTNSNELLDFNNMTYRNITLND